MNKIRYKVVRIEDNKLYSFAAMDQACVEYKIGTWVKAPRWLAEKGYYLCVFKDLQFIPEHVIDTQIFKVFKCEVKNKVSEFIQTRFHHQMTSREYDYDVVEAATTAHFVDLVDVFDRINTLQKAKTRPDFQPLAITFKRVANIIASHPHEKVRPLLFVEEAEKNLYEIYQQVETAVQQLIKSRDYPVALNQLAMLKPSVDRFFDDVMVMCEDESLRINRLGLLGKISILFKNIADFSKIVTEEKS